MRDDYVHPQVTGDRSLGTGVSPAGWGWDNVRAWFNGAIDAIMRGSPAPFAARDAYPGHRSPVRQPRPFGDVQLRLTRRYDRGSDAYAYRFGALTYDPLGPGVVTTRPLPVYGPAAVLLSSQMLAALPPGIAKVVGGNAIIWEPQGINYGIQPNVGGPIYTPDQLAALSGNPAMAGGAPSVDGTYLAPGDGGFGG